MNIANPSYFEHFCKFQESGVNQIFADGFYDGAGSFSYVLKYVKSGFILIDFENIWPSQGLALSQLFLCTQ